MKEAPVRTIYKAIAWVTIPALLFWDENKDKEWYKNIPGPWKYMNMWHELEDGSVMRIPGTHELFSIFAGIPIAFLDQERLKDPKAVDDAVGALIKTINPLTNIIPSAFKPFLDVGFNSNWLGQPIEPEWMRDEKTGLPIEERKFFFTPQLSVEFSKGMRALGFQLSPIQMDSIMRQLTGGLYQKTLGLMDTTPNPANKSPLNPVSFLRFPNRPSRQLDEFFTEKTRLQQLKNVDKTSFNENLKLKGMNRFFKDRMKPLQDRIRKQQKIKTVDSMVKINELYGVLAKRMNAFVGKPKGIK